MQDIFLALRRFVDVFVLRLDLASERRLSVVSVVLTVLSIASSVVMSVVPCKRKGHSLGRVSASNTHSPVSFPNNALFASLKAYFSRPVFTTVFSIVQASGD